MTEKWTALEQLTKDESAAINDFKAEIVDRVDTRFDEMQRSLAAKIVTHEQMKEIVELVKAQLEIFDTIYQHSSTVPAPTKEKLTMIHNEALKHATKLEEEDASHDGQA